MFGTKLGAIDTADCWDMSTFFPVQGHTDTADNTQTPYENTHLCSEPGLYYGKSWLKVPSVKTIYCWQEK